MDKKEVQFQTARWGPLVLQTKIEDDFVEELLAKGASTVTFILCAWSGRTIPVVGDGAGEDLHIVDNSVFEDCVSFLISNNYKNVDIVCAPGEYCLRGGIIDVFPSSRRRPVRINFLGKKVSLHVFDPNTQIATAGLDQYSIPSSRCNSLFSTENKRYFELA